MPPFFATPSNDAIFFGDKTLSAINHRIILGFRGGNNFSIKRMLSFSGHGNSGYLSIKACAVIILSSFACSIEEMMASDPAVKFKFTGIFPDNKTAKLATSPPLPGGKTIPTLFF